MEKEIMEMEDRDYIVTMPDGSKWAVPVLTIAYDRARHYSHEYEGDIEKSLVEDTLPLFRECKYEIVDWAKNNMNWSDVVSVAELFEKPSEIDFQDGWVNGEVEIKKAGD